MWEKILTEETLEEIVLNMGDDATEDIYTMLEFTDYLVSKVDYKSIVILATQWKSFEEEKQVFYAISTVGEEHASRFMIMMDSLAERFIEGKLK